MSNKNRPRALLSYAMYLSAGV